MNNVQRKIWTTLAARFFTVASRKMIVFLAFVLLSPLVSSGLLVQTSTNWTVAEHSTVYQGESVIVDGCTVTVAAHTVYGTLAEYWFGELVLTNGAQMVCEAQNVAPYDVQARGICLYATNITVYTNCALHSDGKGFPVQAGPGRPFVNWNGASHGGLGTSQATNIYGSATNPVCLGSGGWYAGCIGGGAVKLDVSNTLLVNGRISANGLRGDLYHGGSGGSVWLIANHLQGNGLIAAEGDWTSSSEPGGGRVAVEYVTSTFAGTYLLRGGHAATRSALPGTLSLPAGASLTVASEISLAPGTYVIPRLTVLSNAALYCQGDRTTTQGSGVVINCQTVQVYQGGTISAHRGGFAARQGPGSATVNWNGASHGGLGGGQTANTYGSYTNPTALGSGAFYALSIGGGALALLATNEVIVDGTIEADGLSDSSTGGSGGSIWISTILFSGSGLLTAKGADNTYYAGGGGRIAVSYNSSSFSGIYNVAGGGPTNASVVGWPGTLCIPNGESLMLSYSCALPAGTYHIPTLIVSNGAMLHCHGNTNSVNGSGVILNCYTVEVYGGSSISANRQGFPSRKGPGAGTGIGWGGNHGGWGGMNTGVTYGDSNAPVSLGSGGYAAGSFGGGAIALFITNSLLLNGTISADANAIDSAGAGGSLWIMAETFSGTGTLSAAGGNTATTNLTGGGGGGRVALICVTKDYSRTPAASGGSGTYSGSSGSAILYALEPDPVVWSSPVNCPGSGYPGSGGVEDDVCGRTLWTKPALVWFVPTNSGTTSLHFRVYYDTADGDTQQADSAIDATAFAFFTNTAVSWTAFPSDGLISTDTQIRVHYLPGSDIVSPGSMTSVYWKVTAIAGAYTSAIPSAWRFVIGGREWTDPTLQGRRIRDNHLMELREEANFARVCAGLSPEVWTDDPIVPNQTLIRDVHITELRVALDELRFWTLSTSNVWTDVPLVPGSTRIKSSHITELRGALE
jgi:hypothetical protein